MHTSSAVLHFHFNVPFDFLSISLSEQFLKSLWCFSVVEVFSKAYAIQTLQLQYLNAALILLLVCRCLFNVLAVKSVHIFYLLVEMQQQKNKNPGFNVLTFDLVLKRSTNSCFVWADAVL